MNLQVEDLDSRTFNLETYTTERYLQGTSLRDLVVGFLFESGISGLKSMLHTALVVGCGFRVRGLRTGL